MEQTNLTREQEEAMELAWANRQSWVYSVVSKLSGDPNAVEDIVQESLLKLRKSIPNYDPRKDLGGWVRRITKSCAIDFYRAEKRKTKKLRFSGEDGRPYEMDGFLSDSEEPREILERRELDVFKGLRSGDREILSMYYRESLPYQEIASRLNIPIGTVGSRLRDAKARLRGSYRERVA